MSLKKNFVYNGILTVSNYLFPLIVYPYISRTLGLSNIGIVNFIDNLVNYFVFLSMFGISTVGVREIASARGHKEKLSKTFASLFMLTFITTLIAVMVLLIAMHTVPILSQYQDLLYVGVVKIVFNLFMIEWFFTGMENFRYITNRSILIKLLYVIGVFMLIKEPADYKLYYILSVAAVAANAVINILYSRHYLHLSFHLIDMRPFYKAYTVMGIYILLTNFYTYLNPVWLGFVTNTDEVGYFTTATKLHSIIMAILLSFTNILFPRVSNLLAEGKIEEFWQKIGQAFEAIFLFAFPTISFMLIAGPELLHILVGDNFEGAYKPLRIISPLIFIVGVEQILIIQILLAMHKDYAVLRNSFWGAITATILNILITPNTGASGSAIVWVVSECIIMGLSILYVDKYFNFALPYKRIAVYIYSYIPLLIVSLVIYNIMNNELVMLITILVLTVFYAMINELLFLKNQVLKQLLNNILTKYHH